MNELLQALEQNIKMGNWYGALFVALSLPDICGKIDVPSAGSQTRYATWFEKYVQPKYTSTVGHAGIQTTFLSGNDCYALRCAFLHEGSDNISGQQAMQAVDRFHFIVAPSGYIIHCNRFDNKLQLQVDIFCQDIRQGVLQWLQSIASDRTKMQKTQSLLKIQTPDSKGGIEIR